MGYSVAPLHAKPTVQRRVRISQFSQLFIIPYDDAKSKWYTQEETRLFNRARISDVLRLRIILNDETRAAGSEDTLYEWVGIERILCPHTARRLVQRRRAHSETVLCSAQIMMMMGSHDDMTEKLAEISKKSSQWARKSAAEIATCYASII
ncbi:hypothetical protein ACHAXA_000169 [Cyclostephanos tholiformis]|jgi:hypothetical protein|uniref:Uncharacterized protein n=1 Tax=Cyclostephanos tholiformis TaxID=382380 RepID=A0ABD3RDU7_9STRA